MSRTTVRAIKEEICRELGRTPREEHEFLLSFETRIRPANQIYQAAARRAQAAYTSKTAAALRDLFAAQEAVAAAGNLRPERRPSYWTTMKSVTIWSHFHPRGKLKA
eukprot:SAG11_NODE_18_length_25850_cov_18.210050_7_plen_107_part_00